MTDKGILTSQALAGTIIAEAFYPASSQLSVFSTWLLGGSGAILGLIIGNAKSLGIPTTAIETAGLWFLFAAVLAVAGKYFAMWLATASGAATGTLKILEAQQEGEPRTESQQQADLTILRDALIRSVWLPPRLLVKYFLNRYDSGDVTLPGRLVAWITQAQGLLLLVQIISTALAAARILKATAL